MTTYKFILYRRPLVLFSVFVILYAVLWTNFYHQMESVENARIEDTVVKIEKKRGKSVIWTKTTYATVKSSSQCVRVGDIIILEGTFEDVLHLKNPSYAKYLKSQGITYMVDKPVINQTGRLDFSHSLRARLTSYLEERIDKKFRKRAYLWKALFYGDKSELPKEIKSKFSILGISHILAISGFHVGIIALFFHLLLSRVSMKTRNVLICIFLVGYTFFTGSRASIVRAVGFYLLYYFSFLVKRKYDLLTAVAFFSTILLIHNPWKIYDMGFQLSFLSVTSIGIFYPKLHRKVQNDRFWNVSQPFMKLIKKAIEYLVALVEVTISAQILTLPLCIYYFHQIPIYSILANIIVIPIITIGMMLFLIIFFIPNGAFVESYMIELCNKGMDTMLFLIEWMTQLSFADLQVKEVSIYSLLAIYLLIILWYFYDERNIVRKNFYDIQRTKKKSCCS